MKISISIPTPCHEPWKDMTPAPGTGSGNGRHCAQCDHVVADLTRATDAELVALFTSDARPKCARFDPAQLDRALGAADQRSSNPLPIAAFSSLLAIASGHEALAQQGAPIPKVGEVAISAPAPPPPQVMGKMMAVPHSIPPTMETTHITGDTVVVTVEEPLQIGQARVTCVIPPEEIPAQDPPPPMLEVCGKVVDEATGESLPFVAVGLQNTPLGITTDMDGNFTLKVPQRFTLDPLVLELRYVGYENRTREVFFTGGRADDIEPPTDLTMVPVSLTADPKDPRGVQGRLIDPTTGMPLPDVIVAVKGSEVRVRCDAQGHYFLHVPEALGAGPFTIQFTQNRSAPQEVVLSAQALPACIAQGFILSRAPAPPTQAGSTCTTVGTITMAPRQVAMTVGMMVVRRVEEKPTVVQRITGPMIRTWRRLVH
jgi:hypothetical protein